MPYQPIFKVSHRITNALTSIERARGFLEQEVPLPRKMKVIHLGVIEIEDFDGKDLQFHEWALGVR